MSFNGQKSYVCIHGHFYQPPRVNPWLEAIEREVSASPYHDWNERICHECYRANAASRLVDSENRILKLHNNYAWLNFNVGPTLLSWIVRQEPWLYDALCDADRESCSRFNGHGNAMAQVYNHIIMPLANLRDKRTQVRWGCKDFEVHFGRKPEGMWLAETAVDDETLQVLAEAGIRFTVLSPYQAARWRFVDVDDAWHEVPNGGVPTGRAYRYRCRNGAVIHLFFYDASLARGVAFGDLLQHSSRLVGAIRDSAMPSKARPGEAWLVNIATDGESYGHHFRFGDMALAAAFDVLKADPQWKIINYAAFLDRFPVVAEVEIIENTAWSCSHGLGRWRDDCGCSLTSTPGWTQQWRRPLRDAMNMLRDRLAEHYEHQMGRFAEDPWEVRDLYIDVLVQTERSMERFCEQCCRRELTEQERVVFYQLLEMQRCSLFMFTSCGWFFDEISGLESRLILEYAARAMQLAEATGCDPLEPAFLEILRKARSNLAEYGDGAQVYLRCVKPKVVEKDLVLASFAMKNLGARSRSNRVYCYRILAQEENDLGAYPIPCIAGRCDVEDTRTGDRKSYCHVTVGFGGLDFRCSVKRVEGAQEYEQLLAKLKHSVEEQDTVGMLRVVDAVFGRRHYRLQDVFEDFRQSVALKIGRQQLAIYTDFQRYFYNNHRQLMWSLKQWGISLPEDLRDAIRRVLSHEVQQTVLTVVNGKPHTEDRLADSDVQVDLNFRIVKGRLRSLLAEAKAWDVGLDLVQSTDVLKNAMTNLLGQLLEEFRGNNLKKLFYLYELAKQLDVRPEPWLLQTMWYEVVELIRNDEKKQKMMSELPGFANEFDQFLDCRFMEKPVEDGC